MDASSAPRGVDEEGKRLLGRKASGESINVNANEALLALESDVRGLDARNLTSGLTSTEKGCCTYPSDQWRKKNKQNKPLTNSLTLITLPFV